MPQPNSRKEVLTPDEHARLVRICAAAATDPDRMYAAIETMLRAVNSADRGHLKIRLGLVARPS